MFSLRVPPPAETPNNPDLAAALAHISSATIPHAQRNVLRATANYACNPEFLTSLLQIQKPAHLDFLASVCRRGLIAFRNRGGRVASTSCSTPDGPPSIDSPTPTLPNPTLNLDSYPELSTICATFSILPSSLIPTAFVTPPSHLILSSRPMCFADEINARYPTPPGPHCLVTGASVNVVGGHIIPYSLAKTTSAPSSMQTSFWMFLALFLGEQLRDELWECFTSGVMHTSANGLSLAESVHGFFDRGLLTFDPVGEYQYEAQGVDGCGSGRGEMKMKFVWHYWERELELLRTFLPRWTIDDHEDVTDADNHGSSRGVRSGDIFKVYTRDTELYPLPGRGFLQLHDLLWRSIGAAGLLDDPDNLRVQKRKMPASRKRKQPNQTQVEVTGPTDHSTPHTSHPPATLADGDPPRSNSDQDQERIAGQGPQRSVSSSSTSTISSIFDNSATGLDEEHTEGSIKTWHARLARGPSSSPPANAAYIDDEALLPKQRKRKRGETELEGSGEMVLDTFVKELEPGKNKLALVFRDSGHVKNQNTDTELKVERAMQALRMHFPKSSENAYHPALQQYAWMGTHGLERWADDSDSVSGDDGWESEGEDIPSHMDQGLDDCMQALVGGL